MVAGAGSDDTARPLPVRQMRNLVVGAAQLEAEDRLQVLALEKDFVVETLGQAWRLVERRLPRHVVDATGEHVAKKLGEFGGDEHRLIVSGAFGLEVSGRRWAEAAPSPNLAPSAATRVWRRRPSTAARRELRRDHSGSPRKSRRPPARASTSEYVEPS